MQILCIQNFINNLDETLIPKALLRRLRRGYSNQRIIEDFTAMLLKAEMVYLDNQPTFLVPYCNLALNIGLAHGLGLYQVRYPSSGYFANPENTLDDIYHQVSGESTHYRPFKGKLNLNAENEVLW